MALPVLPQTGAVAVVADANGRGDAVVWQGSPVLLRASLILARGESVRVGIQDGQWPSAMAWSISGPDGKDPGWPVQLVQMNAAEVTLAPLQQVTAIWTLSPEDSARLAPGIYQAAVTFDTTKRAAEGAWAGSDTSRWITIEVSAEPPEPTDEDRVQRAAILASYQSLTGDTDAAVATLRQALEAAPGEIVLLLQLAETQESGGLIQEALASIERAVNAFYERFPNSDHPPAGLLLVQRRIEAQMAEAGVRP